MAKIELPVRSFIESFMRRAFPERDFSRGSGINDLVVKAFAVLMQPIRHEIDVVKVNQSLTNYLYMRQQDLDALAANWGKFRQTGSRIEGNVRLLFNEAADYSLTFLEFVDDAGSTYNLTTPVSITTSDLVANRRADGSFYYDVRVRSSGVGDRYVVPAGTIRTVRGGPAALFACENTEDFQVSAPNESNFDVVNSMYRNIGMRNLVSRSSIRAPLLDQFSNLIDIYIAGSDHPKMYRDLLTVDIDSQPVELHLGGTVDVWCNTNSVSQKQVTLSYLPSTQRVNIVSADQAAAGELAYSFSRGLLSAEGMFVSPDDVAVDLDESFSVVIDVDGIPTTNLVTAADDQRRWPIAAKDLTGGSDLVFMPCRGQSGGVRSVYAVDPIGPNIANTPVTVGDMISTSNHGRRRITAKTGRVMELSPLETVVDSVTPDADADPGDRLINSAGIHAIARVNDHVRINTGAAAGQYTVLATVTDQLYVGRPVAGGVVEEIENLGGGEYRWRFRGDVDTASTVVFSAQPVDEVVVNVSVTEIYFQSGFDIGPGGYGVQVGDLITLAGVHPSVNGTFAVAEVYPTGPRHRLVLAFVGVSVAAPAPGTASVSRPATYRPATLPPEVDTSSWWIYVGTNGAHGLASVQWARITDIVRSTDDAVLTVTGPALTPGGHSCTVVGGLIGRLLTTDTLAIERDLPASFASTSVLDDAMNPTLYVNTMVGNFAAGSTDITAIGIGEQAQPGDLVVFTGLSGLSDEDLRKTGGDGSKVTAFVGGVLSVDKIRLAAPFAFTVPAGTDYTVTRNASVAATCTVGAVNSGLRSLLIPSFPRGVGDAVGMALRSRKPVLTPSIQQIDAYDNHARVSFVGSPSLSPLYISDVLTIDDIGTPTFNGTYRIISIDPLTFSVVIEAAFGSSISSASLTSRVERDVINMVTASTAGTVRTLSFAPPKKVYRLTMSTERYTSLTQDDVGKAVEQVVGNTTYRGTVYSFDNVARVWEIEPTVLGVDVFSDAIPTVATLGGFESSTPYLSETNIVFPALVDVSSVQPGDRLQVTGGTAIDGIYFVAYVNPVTRMIRVTGGLTAVAGPGPHGAVTVTRPNFVKVVTTGTKSYPQAGGVNTNAGAGFVRGYVAPGPGDVGKIVRQGAFTGLLDGFSVAPGVYDWYVKPIADTDTFNSTADLVFIANSPTSPVPADPQGTLLKPASSPALDLSTVTLITLDTPVQVPSDTVTILPRFSRSGGMVVDSTFIVNPNATAGQIDFVAAGVTPGHTLLLMTGDGLGSYEITEVTETKLTLTSSPGVDLVKIANAPPPSSLPVPSGGLNLTSNPAIVIPGSSIGVWGGAGRILRISGGGRTYCLPLLAPPANDAVQPAYGLPVTLAAATRWTWEIVEGLSNDFWILDPATPAGYRIYHPPNTLGTTLMSRSTGTTSLASSSFRDAKADFRGAIGAAGTDGEILLYIDSGESANVEPYVVDAVLSGTELSIVGAAWTTAESDIQYRIVYRKKITAKEGWYRGTITAVNKIKLDIQPGTDVRRNSSLAGVVVEVEPSPYGALVSPWTMPRLTGRFDPSTSTIAFDVAGNQAHGVGSDAWVNGSGFAPDRLFDLVRVHLRTIDRNQLTSADGTVVNTYNYYTAGEFFSLPVVRIQAVELLDIETLAPIRALEYTFAVKSKGLRYSADETNAIDIADPAAKFQPIRVTYVADPSIRDLNSYLNNPDTRVLGQSAMAKRMETISIDLTISVRSEKSSTSISVAIASYINALRSTARLTKVELVKYLFDQSLVSYIDLDTMVMSAKYYSADGTVVVSENVSEYFGSDIACYLAGTVTVLKITAGG